MFDFLLCASGPNDAVSSEAGKGGWDASFLLFCCTCPFTPDGRCESRVQAVLTRRNHEQRMVGHTQECQPGAHRKEL